VVENASDLCLSYSSLSLIFAAGIQKLRTCHRKMYRIVPLDKDIAADEVARRELDEFFGGNEDTLWVHTNYCEAWERYELLHWDECYQGCGCEAMKAADIFPLLPHNQETTPPRGYVRQYSADNTKLSPPSPSFLFAIAFPIVQKLLLNFVTVAHYPSWHFADFKHAQHVLQEESYVLAKISYLALPPLDYFTKHHPGDNCNKRGNSMIAERP